MTANYVTVEAKLVQSTRKALFSNFQVNLHFKLFRVIKNYYISFSNTYSTMSRRTITTVGLIGAAGVGYYFYSAGGDPKVAQKMAERMKTFYAIDTLH